MEHSKEELIGIITQVVSNETGYPVDGIASHLILSEDLDIDSISTMTILVNVEEKLGVHIPEEDWPSLTSVDDIVEYVLINH